MNSKYKNFLISNYIIVAFIILISLASNYILISMNSFSQDTFIPISIFTISISLFLYKYLSNTIFDELFKSDKNIDNMLKKTIHELNTPVATIQMNLKMISKNIVNEKDIKRAKRIEESCNNLLKLYQNMEYEISSNVSNINLENCDIKDMISNSISKVSDIKNNISIIDKTSSSFVLTDTIGFETMTGNLIINAIKYNKKDGFIKISNQNNILKIEDSGYGIDTKNIFKVYDKYFQEDNLHQGFGLGLNIVKEFCDKYKIIIKIDSKEDIGTTFSLDYSAIVST